MSFWGGLFRTLIMSNALKVSLVLAGTSLVSSLAFAASGNSVNSAIVFTPDNGNIQNVIDCGSADPDRNCRGMYHEKAALIEATQAGAAGMPGTSNTQENTQSEAEKGGSTEGE